ncbi:serine hydrolase domain-containing protein [Nocardia nova]|nr:serine hydrolase domain-containing protein [Nocardia nova]
MGSMRRIRRIVAGGVAAMFALTACDSGRNTDVQPLSDSDRAAVRQALDAAVATGLPGVQVVVTEGGRDWTASAGVGNIDSAAPFPNHAVVRAGSNTKAFVAAAMMQLVAEGRVDLDAPVERYLPGTVRGERIEGSRITVRNLMQHTSGVPEYLELPELDVDYDVMLTQHHDAADLVQRALSTMPAHFPPGEKAEYSNTNYLLVGMVLEKVTGHPVGEEVTRRIIEPLDLRHTYFPAAGDLGLRDPHPQSYEDDNGARVDVTRLDTTWAGAAGALVSTGEELNRFFTALLAGKLVAPTQLAQMQRDIAPLTNRPAGIDYGLGLARLAVPCDTQVWGHGGSIPGFRTYAGVTAVGRAVTVVANQRPTDPASATALQHVFDAAVCART